MKESGIGRTPKQAKDKAACKLIHLILKKIEKEKSDKLQNNFQNLTLSSNVKQINNFSFKKRIKHNLPIHF